MKKFSIIVLAGLVITIATTFFLKGKIVHEKFDSKIWKTAILNSELNWSLRWDMMNDLRNKYNLAGMSKNEIINLLGTPETETDSAFRYYLGYSKRGINTGSLIILFGKDDIAIEIKVWQG
ncbi:MAG TPA: hypothetical protein VN451_05210 [Chitinophagaceae bacterium]|nr:hypothetical protein [Chitinophagaceae bacterium]